MDIRALPEDVELTEAELLEEQRRAEQERVERVQSLGNSLATKLKGFISSREPIERRMIEDLRQYHGRYDRQTEAVMEDPNYKRSKVFANITRSKTNAAISRISDMLFPADDRNWLVQATPVPELSEMSKEAGIPEGDEQIDESQHKANVAQAVLDQAKRKAQQMQREIDDQLTECRYNVEARRMLQQAGILGTGVLKGPVNTAKVRRAWRKVTDPATGQSVQVLEMKAETKPAAEWVDVWNFYPDLSANHIGQCEAIFERKFLSRKQLRDLAKAPGYLHDKIREVLEGAPKDFSTSIDHLERLREISGVTGVVDDTRFECWEYHGPIDISDLKACGCDIEDDDVMAENEAVVLFIGEHVIFADLNPMETGDRPYSVWQWEEDECCIFGYGVPYLMRTPQRILNASWRMLMDNSGSSVGPQVAVKRDKVEPANGVWSIEPMKLWYITDPNIPVNDAFATYDINSHQPELANIINMAEAFADKETNLPMIAQGEMGTAPDTATGMSMLMNSANTVLRKMVKLFDDEVTKPMITRFYDWNMQFSEDESIKGDFNVDARGSTALMAKELQTQQLMQFGTFYGHPAFAPILAPKAPAYMRKIAESLRLSPDEVVPTDDEIAEMQKKMAEQPPQKDPRVETAEIRANAEMKRAEYEAKADQTEMTVRKQMAEQDHALKISELQLTREIKMLELAATKELTLEQIKASLADTAIKERSKKQLFAAEAKIKAAQGSGI